MANEEFDPWALSTGLPDTLDVYIEEAFFAFDPNYNDGQTLVLKFTVQTDDDEFGEAGRGELMYPCGTGWESAEGGAVAVREDGSRKGFNNNSAYGLFIAAALGLDGTEDLLRGRGDPRQAGIWLDTSWHLDRKERDFGGDIGKRSRLLPTAFLGEGKNIGGGGAAPAPAKAVSKAAAAPVKAAAKAAPAVAKAVSKAPGPVAAPTPTKAAAPVAKAAPRPVPAAPKPAPAPPTPAPVAELPAEDNGEVSAGLSDEARQALYDIAMRSDTHEQFVEAAYSELEWVAGNPEVEQEVLNPAEGSIWAQAVADFEASQA